MVENIEAPQKSKELVAPPKFMDLKRSRGGLTDEVLNSESIEEARYKLMKIKCIRDDIRSAEILFMEYQAKLKFGYEDEAKTFLTDVLKQPENKDFIYHVIYYLTLEYQRLGYEEVSMFRNTLMAYDFDKQRELFQAVIVKHPNLTCELLLTLLSVVNEAARRALNPHEAAPMIILQNRLIDYVMKNETSTKKVRGFWNLGQSLITTQFHDMDDRKIQFVYDLFIKSCLQECYCKSELDTKENRQNCNISMSKYIQKFGALAFFVKIMQKIDSTKLIPTSFETFSVAHELSFCVPSTWSPAMRPYLLFFLTGARIQLPLINPDVLYLPYRRLMHTVPTETVQKMEESAFRDSFTGLSALHVKLAKFKEADEAIKFVDPQLYFFITFGHYYSERYAEVGKMEEHFPNDDLQFKVLRFCADLFIGKKPVKELVELAKIALENDYTKYDPEFTTEFLAGPHKRCHAILPKEKLGQWLLFIASQALDLCDKDDETMLIAQLIVSQFELDKFGKDRLAYAYENIKDKASLKSVQLDKYIVKDALFHRFVILSQKFDSPWNPKECYQNRPKSISEQELLKLLLTFLRDDSSLL